MRTQKLPRLRLHFLLDSLRFALLVRLCSPEAGRSAALAADAGFIGMGFIGFRAFTWGYRVS